MSHPNGLLRRFPRPWVLLLLLAACESSPSDMGERVLELRIANDTQETITVRLAAAPGVSQGEPLEVDFGSIAPGQTTPHRPVSSAFFVLVNGTPFPGEDMVMGVSDPPSARWTLRIQPGGGWSQDADLD